MPHDWWGGSSWRNLEAYSQNWRWKQVSPRALLAPHWCSDLVKQIFEPIQIFWINVGLAVMPRDWWGGSRRRNLEAYSQSWRWKQASISTETTNFSMRGQTEDRWFHHHLLRLHNGGKSFFKQNSEPIFTVKYGRLWLPILSPFMYWSTYKWELFGMTDVWNDNKLFHAWSNRGQMVSSSSPPTTQWSDPLKDMKVEYEMHSFSGPVLKNRFVWFVTFFKRQ